MEGLAIAFGGFLAALVGPLASLVFDVALGLICLVVRLLTAGGKSEKKKSRLLENLSEKSVRRIHKALTILVIASVFVFCIFAGFFIHLDTNKLPEITRWTLKRVKDQTGYAIEFESVEGSLLRGSISFHDVHVAIQDPTKTVVLDIGEVRAKWSLPSLLFGTVDVDTLQVRNISGDIGYFRRKKNLSRLKKAFRIHDFKIDEANVSVLDRDRNRTWKIKTVLESNPFLSSAPIWSVLFRSNGFVQVDDRMFRVATAKFEDGMCTTWTAADLPAPFLATWIPVPFGWLDEGTVDLSVHDRWQYRDVLSVDLSIEIELHDANASVPDNASSLKKTLLHSVVDVINTQRDLNLDFGLRLNYNDFASGDAMGDSSTDASCSCFVCSWVACSCASARFRYCDRPS